MNKKKVQMYQHQMRINHVEEKDQILNKKYFRTYKISVGNKHVGTICMNPCAESAIIGNFIIYEQYRRKGFGNAALVSIIDHLLNCMRFTRVVLYVNTDNTPAINLYKKAGFKIINQTHTPSHCMVYTKPVQKKYSSPWKIMLEYFGF